MVRGEGVKGVKHVALLFFLGVLAGCVVMVFTFMLIGMSAKHLPGGSGCAGACLGLVFPRAYGMARWCLVLVGVCAGCTGWLLATHLV
ncbi:hypothetical protein Krac_7818 [Ktedonobacter racemifer DSM 44963]|uniref:Uncharacterized protein n=1 Tax=Ktedonobacter racemifer DSM 44963 TaxID=485913 RepID=D6TL68_KTERA|nr:hypothetical protein Krac_7818 [Ktedonobacter racemifer DSM 44963]